MGDAMWESDTAQMVAFLRARLDEEADWLDQLDDVQTHPYTVWHHRDSGGGQVALEVQSVKDYRVWWYRLETADDDLIEWKWRPHPEAVRLFDIEDVRRRRADVEAKRRIVNRYESLATADVYSPADIQARAWPLEVTEHDLRDLVSVYADHPNYDPRWRP